MKKVWLNSEECSGCGACENICPKDAIHLVPDKTGFFCPVINGNCIDCNACEKVCRNRLVLKHNDIVLSVFAAWTKDSEIRFHSTSGGMFSELSKEILRRGGAVAGAAYSENMAVRHEIETDEEGLARIRQSKYVQSEIGLVFRDIKNCCLMRKLSVFAGHHARWPHCDPIWEKILTTCT